MENNKIIGNQTLEQALHLLCCLAATSAEVSAYSKHWGPEFSVKEINEKYEQIRKETSVDFWKDVFNLSEDDKLVLGFKNWSEEKPGKMMIPLWIVQCLPEDFDIEVECIDGEKVSIKNIDKDVRFGCVAYMI